MLGPLWMTIFWGVLIEQSQFRSSNRSFKYNKGLDRKTLICDNTSSTEEVILGK